VRNYQARNLLRDEVREGDLGLFYHSSADPPGVAGIVRIVGAAEADPTQFDPRSEGYDARSRPESPTWLQVVVEAARALPRFVPLEALRAQKALAGLPLLRRGRRLSIQPVGEKEWSLILALGGLEADPD
jgi:predicted RNA-binding protein with PUA-like domain